MPNRDEDEEARTKDDEVPKTIEEWECKVPGCTGPHHLVLKNMVAAGYKLSGENKAFLVKLHKEKYCVGATAKAKEKSDKELMCAFCQKVLGSKAVTTKGEEEQTFCEDEEHAE